MGKAGSGKDSILNRALEIAPSLHKIILYTTRDPRENEKNGESYFFCSKEEFRKKIQNNEFYDYQIFNGDFYGVSKESFSDKLINIGVFSPKTIQNLMTENFSLQTFYIHTNDRIRIERQVARETDPDLNEIRRRLSADKIDFEEDKLPPHQTLVNDQNFGIELCARIIVSRAN